MDVEQDFSSFFPKLIPVSPVCYRERLITYLAESEIIVFRGYIPVLKIYIIML